MTEHIGKKLKPVTRGTIVDEIIDSITDSIIKGYYTIGTKLPSEFKLMGELGVSRNSLREAMKILEAMGIVEIRRGDGTYICSQTSPSLFDKVIYSIIYDASSSEELLELRQVLDEATVRLAIEQADTKDIEKLQLNIEQMRRALKNKDIESMQAIDIQFHMVLIDSCKNIFFIRIMKGVYTIFENSIMENVAAETIDSKAAEYHQNILDCILNKDYKSVSKAVFDSLETWRKRI
ncbi:FadR/GntR family transcriptional regulator [Enterococcus sp. DIV0187]|uniref:FadR/GntR family transcriptional regulator n=1 Tax=Enterococcus sp. DIV0187 TaxID=2774644 RepID=UPI003F289E96